MDRPALHGALVLFVVCAGCAGLLADDPPRDERAVAAVSETVTALEDVESYRYESDLHASAADGGRTEHVDARVVGTVDASAKRMNATTEMEGRTLETYLVNRTAYRQCARPRGFWGVENQSVEDWDTLTPAHRQLSLLSEGALRYEGATTVDGRDATLVVGEPTPAALRQYGEERGRPLLGGPEVRDVRMEVWIDDETDLPLRTRLRFEVSGGDGSATARMVTRFQGYGEPVTVEVPEEALEDHLELGCPGE